MGYAFYEHMWAWELICYSQTGFIKIDALELAVAPTRKRTYVIGY